MVRRSSRGCPQQVVRVGFIEFRERHDTRTNWQHYTAADRRPTNQVSAWQAERGSRPFLDTLDILLVSGVYARMLRGCYEETAAVEFRLNRPPPSPSTFRAVQTRHRYT